MIGGIGLLIWWYDWGVFLGFLIAVAITFWIFYDAQQRWVEATIWKVITAIGTLLVIPSLIAKFALASVLASLVVAPDPNVVLSTASNLVLFASLGVLGAVLAIVAAFGYAVAQPRAGVYPPGPAPGPVLPPTERAAPPTPPPPPPRPARVERTRLVEERPPAMAWLAVKSGPRAGKQFGLTMGRSTIGRDATRCDIVLDDGAVSAEHAAVIFQNGQFVIHDLASLNGTFVNNMRVQRQSLLDGDVIRVGNTAFVFKKV